ncbi:hypothetical protein VT84_04740 [Gemmata sp. SH-PL17]|nr:hypothetical protein VT84_04740 [Gemmata sp. SH-PL17]
MRLRVNIDCYVDHRARSIRIARISRLASGFFVTQLLVNRTVERLVFWRAVCVKWVAFRQLFTGDCLCTVFVATLPSGPKQTGRSGKC